MNADAAALEPYRPNTRTVGRRLGNRKDRTGCITCKIRRVKCDEGKPACKRCTSTGRTCDGYAPSTLMVRPQTTPPGNTLLNVRPQQLMGGGVSIASHQQYLSFQFFTHAGASSLAGGTDVSFWTRLVPQCAHTEAAVFNAAASVGALLMRAHYAGSGSQPPHTQAWLPPPSATLRTELSVLAIELQNKAIQSTVRNMPSERGLTVADAMTFMLLFCIEALQGRETEALELFERGINALTMAPSTARSAINTDVDAQLDRVRLLCGMFNGGGANAASPGRKRARALLLAPHPIGPFTSLNTARDELSDLIAAVQHAVAARWGYPSEMETPPHSEIAEPGQTLTAALYNWHVRFGQYLVEAGIADGDAIVVSLLRLRCLIARVWLADGPDRSEMMYDSYLDVFGEMVGEADLCLQRMHLDGWYTPPPFTFEMGLIPPLYWTVLKCRHPRLRRQALALLRQAPAQEGLWSRRIMVQVASRIILHEEGGSDGPADLGETGLHVNIEAPGPTDTMDVALPPEAMRIKMVQVRLRKTLADGSRGDPVLCFGRPDGPDGDLKIVKEFIALA